MEKRTDVKEWIKKILSKGEVNINSNTTTKEEEVMEKKQVEVEENAAILVALLEGAKLNIGMSDAKFELDIPKIGNITFERKGTETFSISINPELLNTIKNLFE
jgi:hypothetical protein